MRGTVPRGAAVPPAGPASSGRRIAGAGLLHIHREGKEEPAMAFVRWNPLWPWRPSQEPWSPWEGMESWRRELDQFRNAFFRTVAPAGAQESLWYPWVDLREHDQEFVFVADLPGMQQEDIHITVENNVLTLQGTRTCEHEAQNGHNGYAQYRERAYGTFCRRFTLGAAV